MIILKTLRWSNAFSYGKDNTVSFINGPLTQLVGKNGHGKSSIALILEEVLFNKNSKGIKKADILNRYTKDKNYTIELDFDKDGVEYQIKTTRGATQAVKLFKFNSDISAHTATATYKMIEDIIGFDHKTFAQIVYQSNASSLEFLTAPDTARKKFLIELLNLGRYTKAQEVFKEVANDLNKDIVAVDTQVKTINSWLDKYSSTNLTLKPIIDVPVLDEVLITEQANIESSLKTLDQTNKKITTNNTYKQIQSNLKVFPIPNKPSSIDSNLELKGQSAITEQIELNKTIRDSQAFVTKMNGLSGTCPTCLQTIDENKIQSLLAEQEDLQQKAKTKKELAEAIIAEYKQNQIEYKDKLSDASPYRRALEFKFKEPARTDFPAVKLVTDTCLVTVP
jgi:DNA repair exonuclease SbcCD ATPase subunit